MARYADLVQGLQAALQQGNQPLAEALAARIEAKDYEEESSMAASALQGIGQGATFGLADEAGAGLRAGLVDPLVGGLMAGFGVGDYKPTGPGRDDNFWDRMRDYQEQFTAWGDKSLGESYQDALGSQRQALETARREDPWTTGIAEVVGGLGTGGVGATRAVAGQTLREGAKRLAGAGLVMGGIGGYGYGEGDPLAALAFEETDDVMRELKEAGVNVGLGAVMGAGFGAAMPYLGAGARGLLRVVARPLGFGRVGAAELSNEGNQMILRSLQDDIDNGFIKSIDDLQRQIAETPGMTIADAGPAMRELTENLVQRGGPAAQELTEFLTTRNVDQYKRIFPNLARALSDEGDNFAAARRRIIQETQENANAAFEAAYGRTVRVTQDMVDEMAKPQFRRALSVANQLRAEAGKDPLPEFPPLGTMMSTKELHNILQGMDEVVSRNFKTSPTIATQITKPARDRFRDYLYRENPALRDARNQYGSDKLRDEALDKGLRLLRDDADITADVIRGMSEGERAMFRVGALRAITRRLLGKSDTSDLTKGIFDNPRMREAVEVAFGDSRKFREFMDFIAQEQRMFETFRQATGNSATARRLMSQSNEHIGRAAGLMGFGATGSLLVGATAKRAAQGIANIFRPAARQQARQQAMDQQISGALTQGGDVTGLLQRLQQPNTLGGLLGTGVPTTAAGATGGLLSTGLLQPELGAGGNMQYGGN